MYSVIVYCICIPIQSYMHAIMYTVWWYIGLTKLIPLAVNFKKEKFHLYDIHSYVSTKQLFTIHSNYFGYPYLRACF